MQFTFKIITYGCKVNQYESQSIREYWKSLGGQELFDNVCPHVCADVLLLSGCAVTAQGVSDARQMVRKLLRDCPKTQVIVTGCAASAEPNDFNFENVIACIAQTAKWNLLYFHPLELRFPKGLSPLGAELERQSLLSRNDLTSTTCNTQSALFTKKEREYPEFSINDFERSRPVLKIQDGCSHGCSYCIVPLTRGRARSRDLDESLAEFSRLVHKGFREIVISGINLRQYHFNTKNDSSDTTQVHMQTHMQTGRGNFWGFLRQLHKHVKAENFLMSSNKKELSPIRIRLSSLEPSQINQEGLDTLAQLAEDSFLCPHLHLSLQSGSERVLKRMGREHYAPETIIEIMQKVGSFWRHFALGADFLMGFAGESEDELQETLHLVEQLPLTYAHVFPYSIRPNTKAATFTGHLEKKVRQEHAKQVRELIDRKKEAFLQSMLQLKNMHISLNCLHESDFSDIFSTTSLQDTKLLKNLDSLLAQEKIKLAGWNEYYVSCQIDIAQAIKDNFIHNIEDLKNILLSHELLKVKPIKIKDDKLVTELFKAD